MKPWSCEIEKNLVVELEVDRVDRWQVYQRLQELDIPCCCETNQPLIVEINNPLALVQLSSVMQRFRASRQDLISSLEDSWKSRYGNF